MNRKIITDRDKISSGEIAERREFDKIEKDFSQLSQPFYKAGWFKLGSALIAAAIVTAISALLPGPGKPVAQQADKTDSIITKVSEAALVSPPVSSLDIAYNSYTINAAEGGEIQYQTGSVVSIPGHAFTDESGNILKGDVEVRYREFHDPVDFFFSGIPMTYDTLGETHHFESAGMLDIRAYQDGKPVKVNPDKAINVKMASEQPGNHYNLYFLDTNAREWVCEGKPDVEIKNGENRVDKKPIDELFSHDTAWTTPEIVQKQQEAETVAMACKELAREIETLKETAPLKPQKAIKGKFKFNIEVNLKEFPEMAAFSKALFQVSDKNEGFNPKDANLVWESVDLSKGAEPGEYIVTFSRPERKLKVIANPVVEEDDYEKAIATYNTQFAQYTQKLESRKAEEKRQKEAYEHKLRELEAERQRMRKAMEEATRNNIKITQSRNDIYRTFNINRFGVWNCDSPQQLPRGNVVDASFLDKEGNLLYLHEVCLVDRSKNAIFKYWKDKFDRFRYNPDARTMVWAITSEGKLAYYSYEEFAAMPRKRGPFTFRMTILDQQFGSVDEIKTLFDI